MAVVTSYNIFQRGCRRRAPNKSKTREQYMKRLVAKAPQHSQGSSGDGAAAAADVCCRQRSLAISYRGPKYVAAQVHSGSRYAAAPRAPLTAAFSRERLWPDVGGVFGSLTAGRPSSNKTCRTSFSAALQEGGSLWCGNDNAPLRRTTAKHNEQTRWGAGAPAARCQRR